MSMTPEEVTQWVEDTRRKSFKNGWNAAVERTVDWLEKKAILGWIEDEEVDKFVEQYLKEIEL